MKDVYAYVRVSTVKQGEKGSSLEEQRDAISAFARRRDLRITAWFEEMETAAKLGRREYSRMLSLLTRGKATGVILHKIDRGARNLKDWANLRELTERGIEVHLAHESIDLATRSGALMADIQAVIATDYIRNLRDEVRKGLYGRLKQGIYPFAAPMGYLDRGGGVPKQIDPERGPLICKAFELYATGSITADEISEQLFRLGLRSKSGARVSGKRLTEFMRDPFYMGIIEIKRNKQVFAGVHEPLISKVLFDRVQLVLTGRAHRGIHKNAFLFRRLVRCVHCSYALIGEHQKGHIYYRCHTRECPTTCIREEAIDASVRHSLMQAVMSEEESSALRDMARGYQTHWETKRKELHQTLTLQHENIRGRISRLMDAYLNGEVDRPTFDEKNRSLIFERKQVEDNLAALDGGQWSIPREVLHHLELSQTLPLSYEMAHAEEKRDIVAKLTSNLSANEKSVVVALRSPFREIANRRELTNGGHFRAVPRTDRTALKALFDAVVAYATANVAEAHEGEM
jgi:site-specific DNA recombinase